VSYATIHAMRCRAQLLSSVRRGVLSRKRVTNDERVRVPNCIPPHAKPQRARLPGETASSRPPVPPSVALGVDIDY
jgi:hypothetical protein